MTRNLIVPKPILSVKKSLYTGEKLSASLLKNFKPKTVFEIRSDDLTIRTASSQDDLHLALKLRHEVFLEEGLGRSHRSGMEFDSLDALADHLMIIDNKSERAIGTYRLIHSDNSDQFYSQGEFVLDDFLGLPGKKLEMGRACTHPDHRTGRTVDLLWKGLSKYIELTQTRYLFGCSSLRSMDFQDVFSIVKTLHAQERLFFKWNIEARPQYRYEDPDGLYAQGEQKNQVLRSLPPLFRSYLHAGAQVFGYPALDQDFRCADFFTVLDLGALNKKFQERYLPDYPETLNSLSETN